MPTRRQLLQAGLALPAGLAAPAVIAAGSQPTSENVVTRENQHEGSLDWQLTRVYPNAPGGIRTTFIEGYCSKQSVLVGDSIDIFVSVDPAQNFKLEIFRTGYYGGRGARLMKTIGPLQGHPQPTPEYGEKRLRECRWEKSVTLEIPSDWTSGVYLGRLTTESDASGHGYWQSYIIFIVRDDRPADILFQCSDNTWQAYNQWPAKDSVYTHPQGVQGPWADVSFDRPYGKYPQIYDNPQTIGSGEWLSFEFPLAYWLEQQGYDVTYCSNSDLLSPKHGLTCKYFLSVGHDEYWDIRQYESAIQLREAGVNLLFFSANSVCWVSPYRPSYDGRPNRILYRGGPYGGNYKYAEARHTEHGPFPHRGPDEGYLIGARNVEPVNGGGDWICTNPQHWVYDGTGMQAGDRIPGFIGWEYHGDPPQDIAGLETIAAGTALQGGVRPQQWAATIYPGPKGNIVFNGSTIWWAQGIASPPGHMLPWSHWSRPHGPDDRVQRITTNLLAHAIRPAK